MAFTLRSERCQCQLHLDHQLPAAFNHPHNPSNFQRHRVHIKLQHRQKKIYLVSTGGTHGGSNDDGGGPIETLVETRENLVGRKLIDLDPFAKDKELQDGIIYAGLLGIKINNVFHRDSIVDRVMAIVDACSNNGDDDDHVFLTVDYVSHQVYHCYEGGADTDSC